MIGRLLARYRAGHEAASLVRAARAEQALRRIYLRTEKVAKQYGLRQAEKQARRGAYLHRLRRDEHLNRARSLLGLGDARHVRELNRRTRFAP